MILHITNDYSGSTVYKNLIRELDKLGLSQIVYNPIREKSKIGKNKIELAQPDSKIIYSFILTKYTDRIFYRNKVNKIVSDIERKVDLSKVKFIHAHTWYSDGGVAYLLSKKYDIPYLVAVRNTDLNLHYKFLLHHRNFGKNILKRANKIILIGKYQMRFFDSKIKIEDELKNKMIVIPNGVDSFWIENRKEFLSKKSDDKFKILYVGTFIKRKKLYELQKAIIELSIKNGVNCELNIIGGGGSKAKKIIENIIGYPIFIKYHGIIENKEVLMEKYIDSHIFAMPSKHETFGLVYVEAMLQGLPILYTANEGIDGFYDENIGEKVTSGDYKEIKSKLLKMINNYNLHEIPTKKLMINHNWNLIAEKYLTLYKV